MPLYSYKFVRYLILIPIAVVWQISFAAAGHPFYNQYGPSEGLSSSETYDVIQDKNGHIWVGTDRGVSRFDGYHWISFTSKDGLTDNTVLKIYEDHKGRIWFIPISNRICYFENGKIIPFRYANLIAEKYKGVTRSFYIDKRGSIYMGMMNDGLIRIDTNGRIREMNPELNCDRTYFLTQIDQKILCAIKSRTGANDGRIVFSDDVKNTTLLAKYFVAKNSYLQIIGTKRKNGSSVYYCTGNIVELVGDELLVSPTRNEILGLFEDRDSSLWVSYRHGEVRKFEPNKGINDPQYRSYFPSEVVSSIYQDRDNGYWFTTLTHGILYVPSFGIEYSGCNGKSSISAMSIDKNDHSVYTGYENGKLIRYKNNGEPEILNPDNKDSLNYIYSLVSTGSGLFICGRNKVAVYRNGLFTPVNENVYARHLFNEGDNVYGFTNRMLFSVRLSTGEVKKQPGLSVRGELLYKDANGKVWIGDHTGLYYFRDSVITKAFPDVAQLHSRISGICEDESKNLVVATIGFGVIVIEKNSSIKNITTENGLPSNIVNCIYRDEDYLWIGTNNGLARMELQNQNNIRVFNRNHGLVTNEIRWVGVLDGVVWAASQNYIMRIHPEEISVRKKVTPPAIHMILAAKDTLSSGEIKIRYDQVPLRIYFSSVNFRLKNQIEYKYRIKGLIDDWQYTTQTFVEFLSIPAGKYELEIHAKNEDGFWSSVPAKLFIQVTPPLYKEAWFIVTIALLTIALVIIIARIRINSIRRKNKLVMDIMTYRQKSLGLQMNPHFMSNFLISVQTFVLKENKHDAVKYIAKFSKFMRLVLDNVRSEYITLEQEMDMLDRYLELEQLRFREVFDYSLEVDPSIKSTELFIPTMLMQPFIENCVLHAFNSISWKGKISVRIRKIDNYLECIVEDNGAGFSAKNKDNEHQSAGTEITVKRLELLSKKYGIPFRFSMLHKEVLPDGTKGILVQFNLPYLKKDDKGRFS